MSRFSEKLIEDKNIFRSCIMEILAKLNDVDSLAVAEQEMKSFIVNQVNDGERLSVLISCISDYDAYQPLQVKANQIKLLIIIAEVFQHQILEYFPRIFKHLNTRLLKEKELDMFTAIGDTYAGLLENSLRNTNESDSKFVLEEAMTSLFDIAMDGNQSQQMGVGLVISKIINSTPSKFFNDLFEVLLSRILDFLGKDRNCHSPLEMLESLLSLCLLNQSKVIEYTGDILSVILKFLKNKEPKVRKSTIDNIYSLCVTCPSSMKPFAAELAKELRILKTDKNGMVRKATMASLNALKELGVDLGDIKQNDSTDQSDRQSIRSSRRESSKPAKKKGRNSSRLRATSRSQKGSVIEPPKKHKATKQYGINKKQINPAFQRSGTNDIEIFVNAQQKVNQREIPPLIEQPPQFQSVESIKKSENQNIVQESPESIQKDDKPALMFESEAQNQQQNFMSNQISQHVQDQQSPSLMKESEREIEGGLITDGSLATMQITQVEKTSNNRPMSQRVHEPSLNHYEDIDQSFSHSYKRNLPPTHSRNSSVKAQNKNNSFYQNDVLDYQDVSQPSQSVNKKVVKDVQRLKKTVSSLKQKVEDDKEIIQQQQSQIESLIVHSNNLTTHLNALLNKMNVLEQNQANMYQQRMYQPQQMVISPQAPFSPFQPPIMLQQPQMAGGATIQGFTPQPTQIQMAQQNPQLNMINGNIANQQQQFDKNQKKPKSKWEKRRNGKNNGEGSKKKLTTPNNLKARKKKQEGEEKQAKVILKKPEFGKVTLQSSTVQSPNFKQIPQNQEWSGSEMPFEKQGNEQNQRNEEEQYSEEEQGENEEEYEDEMNEIDINEVTSEILRSDDKKVLHSFLVDDQVSKNFPQIRETNQIKLLAKITDMIEEDPQTFLECSLEWISMFIEYECIGSISEARALRQSIVSTIGSSSKPGMFSDETERMVTNLISELDNFISSFNSQ